MKVISFWCHIGLTRTMNVCIPSLPLPLIAYELIWPQHPDKPALPRKLNMFISLKAKQRMRKYDDMYSTNFIAQGLHIQRELFDKNKSRK
jgi:hypothetical protein